LKSTKSATHSKSVKGKARAVFYEEAEKFAKDEGLLFVEASAKSGLNVEQAFVDASADILEKIKKGVFDDDRVCTLFSMFCVGPHFFFQSPGVKLSQPNTNLTTEGTANNSCCAS